MFAREGWLNELMVREPPMLRGALKLRDGEGAEKDRGGAEKERTPPPPMCPP
ncbi:MAG: hypothetical protein ABL907_02500 [Hyphomicrobium sp.]